MGARLMGSFGPAKSVALPTPSVEQNNILCAKRLPPVFKMPDLSKKRKGYLGNWTDLLPHTARQGVLPVWLKSVTNARPHDPHPSWLHESSLDRLPV